MRRAGWLWVTVFLIATPGIAEDLDPRLAFVKTLEGTWDAHGDHGDSVFEYRVTAGGTAVEERLMAGTPMEMLTVYHMDGKDFVATHYCMLGNQPRLKATGKLKDGKIEFKCDGKVSNSGSHDEQHIHNFTMKMDGDGKLHFAAEATENGAVVEKPQFVLTRR